MHILEKEGTEKWSEILNVQDMGREKKENQGERHFMPQDWQEEWGDGWCEGEGRRSRGSSWLCSFPHFSRRQNDLWMVRGEDKAIWRNVRMESFVWLFSELEVS